MCKTEERRNDMQAHDVGESDEFKDDICEVSIENSATFMHHDNLYRLSTGRHLRVGGYRFVS